MNSLPRSSEPCMKRGHNADEKPAMVITALMQVAVGGTVPLSNLDWREVPCGQSASLELSPVMLKALYFLPLTRRAEFELCLGTIQS